MENNKSNYPQLERLITVIKELRTPETGCPWDLEQTHQTLIPYLIEESFEFIHAIEQGDDKAMEEELGDVLLQVILHAQIASETDRFKIESVAQRIADKLIYRHPHVFKDRGSKLTPEEVLDNWVQLKKKERPEETHYITVKDTHLPALISANRIGKRSRKVNFDWDNEFQVADKVQEEWDEVQEALNAKPRNRDHLQEEIGDLMFSVVQLARHLKFDPEETLRQANLKFVRRFNKVEDLVREKGLNMNEMSVEELEKIWGSVKKPQ